MDQQSRQRQILCRQSEHCAAELRRFLYRTEGAETASQAHLLAAFHELGLQATAQDAGSFAQIAQRVARSVTRQRELSPRLREIEAGNLGLAADWLDQLGRVYRGRFPEPKGLIADLIYSFDLLERASHAQLSGHDERAFTPLRNPLKEDVFAEDPRIAVDPRLRDSWRKDPFSEDPGFGLVLDLLQRTLNHAVSLCKNPITDPFGNDPDPLPATTARGATEPFAARDNPIPEDPFATDPVLPDELPKP